MLAGTKTAVQKMIDPYNYQGPGNQFLHNVIQSGTKFVQTLVQIIVNKSEWHETRHISLLYVFVIVFGLDPAQATIGLEKCWSN